MSKHFKHKPVVKGHVHYHKDERGFFVKCYHECKSIFFSYGFWIGITLGFPLEHYLYEKVWPFTLITKFMGL